MKRAKWFLAAWVVGMLGLVAVAWLMDVGLSGMTSYRFMGFIGVVVTMAFGVMALVEKGFKE